MSKADQILEGAEFPALTRAQCAALVRFLFMIGAVRTHLETKEYHKARDVMNHMDEATMHLLMLIFQAHGCDQEKSFAHWLEQTVPEDPNQKP